MFDIQPHGMTLRLVARNRHFTQPAPTRVRCRRQLLARNGCSMKAVSASTNRQDIHWMGLARSYEKPDRYAAAICIKVRSDYSLRGYSATKAAADPCCGGRNGPQTLSECYEVTWNRLFLFLLRRVLGCLLCLLRFLGHVALHHPKSCLNAGRPSTCMHSEYTIILKLIPRASKKVNDGHAVLRPDEALA